MQVHICAGHSSKTLDSAYHASDYTPCRPPSVNVRLPFGMIDIQICKGAIGVNGERYNGELHYATRYPQVTVGYG